MQIGAHCTTAKNGDQVNIKIVSFSIEVPVCHVDTGNLMSCGFNDL